MILTIYIKTLLVPLYLPLLKERVGVRLGFRGLYAL
jgi:hypothetical protein